MRLKHYYILFAILSTNAFISGMWQSLNDMNNVGYDQNNVDEKYLVLSDPLWLQRKKNSSTLHEIEMFTELQLLAYITQHREEIYEDINNGQQFTEADFKNYLISTFQTTPNFCPTNLSKLCNEAYQKGIRHQDYWGKTLDKSPISILKGGSDAQSDYERSRYIDIIPLLKKFLNPCLNKNVILSMLDIVYTSADSTDTSKYIRPPKVKFNRLKQNELFDIFLEKEHTISEQNQEIQRLTQEMDTYANNNQTQPDNDQVEKLTQELHAARIAIETLKSKLKEQKAKPRVPEQKDTSATLTAKDIKTLVSEYTQELLKDLPPYLASLESNLTKQTERIDALYKQQTINVPLGNKRTMYKVPTSNNQSESNQNILEWKRKGEELSSKLQQNLGAISSGLKQQNECISNIKKAHENKLAQLASIEQKSKLARQNLESFVNDMKKGTTQPNDTSPTNI